MLVIPAFGMQLLNFFIGEFHPDHCACLQHVLCNHHLAEIVTTIANYFDFTFLRLFARAEYSRYSG